ncbi:squalene/phytoene synthase family protein [uncultured Tateyamaria sp.]|uniref:squalene/phytoene synthase family protein n=1 Tax=uncultured Tateyamaria sp. TaxID=455651 RepID=UPI0026298881|nr:squalene/phytoene synthase family protein [uncultured Tateyamaria sp.]
MSLPEPVIACARIVEQGDPDRFRTVMAAPVAARAMLFPIYAMNVEVSRAPWVTQEAMIAEMRLQWWRDALEEIARGRAVRKHEVTTPLAGVIGPEQAKMLDESVTARRWDIYPEPFEDEAHMDAYIDQTAGHLMWTAAAALGAPAQAEGDVRALAFAAGTAAFLRAVPALAAAGRIPLLDGTHEGLIVLAKRAKARSVRPALPKAARPALWPAIGAGKLLDQVIRNPQAVGDGTLPAPLTPLRLGLSATTGRLAL